MTKLRIEAGPFEFSARMEEERAPETGETIAFVGWLGLLRVLSEVMREAGEPAGG